ncbi:hypothetical protein F4859DRAFT_297770 [Xylaria cf. heliscus]|nr:hypothetical protein F4859DRAFT_297770 [Xylaria cf. heliscus]
MVCFWPLGLSVLLSLGPVGYRRVGGPAMPLGDPVLLCNGLPKGVGRGLGGSGCLAGCLTVLLLDRSPDFTMPVVGFWSLGFGVGWGRYPQLVWLLHTWAQWLGLPRIMRDVALGRCRFTWIGPICRIGVPELQHKLRKQQMTGWRSTSIGPGHILRLELTSGKGLE